MTTEKGSKVPTSRLARFGGLASLVGRVAGGMLAEGARQLAQGQKPGLQQMLLTPANAQRVATQLSQMRGAAMKLGQLLSMDAGDLLPPALTAILSQLRANASPMLPAQLAALLQQQWGPQWQRNFSHFAFSPMAAASIGQVHQANHDDGSALAVKIQYPGIATSIDSDIDNVATLLRLSGLLPEGIALQPLLTEAKQQLHKEADYQQEAAYLQRYRQLLADDPNFLLPTVYPELSTRQILTMGFVEGVPVEDLLSQPQALRDRVMSLLFLLLFKEIFEFRLVQTDPNFANYRFNVQTGQLVLLDFGACRDYSAAISQGYRLLFQALLQNNAELQLQALQQIGYFSAIDIAPAQLQAVMALVSLAAEPLQQQGAYDFATSDLASRMREAGMQLSQQLQNWHTPPVDALFLHRKMAGLFLLAKTLKARVDVRTLLLPFIDTSI
ncbi:ubiquinol-cytochrome C reductase [Rheinheimera sp. SA_1]|uniref:ABC1 kinase family protein n=1 Tax=Rheinheimera sp. SA_1 TaxID=1827365 RepID=UPI0008000453|nr:AarF/ABC1/UbiB kinase family protein [Rheinheimera sp. SA_1]OBP17018.1 ubiquinol-cytochrome C reductase [Rheinheimera sp. SA_1]